jgi:hypothetical protein
MKTCASETEMSEQPTGTFVVTLAVLSIFYDKGFITCSFCIFSECSYRPPNDVFSCVLFLSTRMVTTENTAETHVIIWKEEKVSRDLRTQIVLYIVTYQGWVT